MRLLWILLLSTGSLLSETTIVHNGTIVGSVKKISNPSPMSVRKKIPVNGFSTVNFKLPASITLNTHSDKNMIILEIDENFVDDVEVYVENQKLYIKPSRTIQTNLPIKLFVYSKKGINEIEVNSTINLDIHNLDEAHFKLITRGVNKINFNHGKINDLSIQADGNYKIDLNQLSIKRASIQAKGIGSVELTVSDFLNVNLAGLAKVYYFGEPTIKQSIKGLSILKRR